MGIIELLLLSVGLGMDAFAISVCKGISMKKMNWKKAIIIGLYFGGFQALMPVIGYFLGSAFESLITNIDHWIAFILLGIIGGIILVLLGIKILLEYLNIIKFLFDAII